MSELKRWLENPKHRKVYNKCELYDWQKIEWNIIGNDNYPYAIEYNLVDDELCFSTIENRDGFKIGYIHIKEDLSSDYVKSIIYISRGSIKAGNHFSDNGKNIDDTGNLSLKIYALVHKFLSRYTGFVTIISKKDNIYGVSLTADLSLKDKFSESLLKYLP